MGKRKRRGEPEPKPVDWGPFQAAVDLWQKEAFPRAKSVLPPKDHTGRPIVLIAPLSFGERDRIQAELDRGVEREKIVAEAARRIIDGDTSGDTS